MTPDHQPVQLDEWYDPLSRRLMVSGTRRPTQDLNFGVCVGFEHEVSLREKNDVRSMITTLLNNYHTREDGSSFVREPLENLREISLPQLREMLGL